MSRYIGQYISTCSLCLCTKPVRHPPTGELYPLPILEEQWNTLSIDFVVELPKSEKCDTVMSVVDLVSKRTYFILTYTMVTIEEAARLFLYHV